MHGDEEQVHQRFTATGNERPLPILITPEGPKHMDEANIRMWLLGDPKKRTHQAMADEAAEKVAEEVLHEQTCLAMQERGDTLRHSNLRAARSKPQAHSP